MLPKSSSLYAKRMKKLGNENKLLPFPFHNKKQKEKKKAMTRLCQVCCRLLCFKHKQKKKMTTIVVVFFFSNRGKEKKTQKQKNHKKQKKCKEGKELTFLFSLLRLGWSALFALSFSHSFNIELSNFLKPFVPCLLKALSYSNSGALPSFAMEWVGNEVREVGGGYERGMRGKFWGREEGWNIPGQGKRMCFWFIPKTASRASSWTGALVAVVHSSCLAVVEPLIVWWPLTSNSVLQ